MDKLIVKCEIHHDMGFWMLWLCCGKLRCGHCENATLHVICSKCDIKICSSCKPIDITVDAVVKKVCARCWMKTGV